MLLYFILVLLCLLLLPCREERLKDKTEARLQYLESHVALEESNGRLQTCLTEIPYLKDWRVTQAQFNFEADEDAHEEAVIICKGAEDTVYKCTIT